MADQVNHSHAQHTMDRATELEKRLEIFVKSAIEKHGSIETIQPNCYPIDSQKDIDIIRKMIELKTFVSFPYYDNSTVAHYYTVGMWYYWGLPEIIVQSEIDQLDPNFVNLIINQIHGKLYAHYADSDNLDHRIDIDFEKEARTIGIDLNEYGVSLDLERIENEQYMDIKCPYMLWFYMYYMNATMDGDRLKMYPVYRLKLTKLQSDEMSKKILDRLIEDTLNQHKQDRNNLDSSVSDSGQSDLESDQ
jgi:hypothetical protein